MSRSSALMAYAVFLIGLAVMDLYNSPSYLNAIVSLLIFAVAIQMAEAIGRRDTLQLSRKDMMASSFLFSYVAITSLVAAMATWLVANSYTTNLVDAGPWFVASQIFVVGLIVFGIAYYKLKRELTGPRR